MTRLLRYAAANLAALGLLLTWTGTGMGDATAFLLAAVVFALLALSHQIRDALADLAVVLDDTRTNPSPTGLDNHKALRSHA